MDWKHRETITQHGEKKKKKFQNIWNLRAKPLKLAMIRNWPEDETSEKPSE